VKAPAARTYVTPFLDQNLSMTVLTGAAPATYYYSQDGLGSVRTLTDGSGMVANRYDYTAFGQAAPAGIHTAGHEAQQTVDQRYTYTGREATQDPSLMYYRWRMYAPGVGRFAQRDPICEVYRHLLLLHGEARGRATFTKLTGLRNAPRGVPLTYLYGDDRPITFDDPYGLRPCWPWRCYWCACMKSLGFPYPNTWYTTGVTLVGTLGAINGAVATFGADVTLAELAGAGTVGEWALAGSAVLASAWAGGAVGCAANATGQKTKDWRDGCCPDKDMCDGMSFYGVTLP
jgi:RHS repeat-associated protein